MAANAKNSDEINAHGGSSGADNRMEGPEGAAVLTDVSGN